MVKRTPRQQKKVARSKKQQSKPKSADLPAQSCLQSEPGFNPSKTVNHSTPQQPSVQAFLSQRNQPGFDFNRSLREFPESFQRQVIAELQQIQTVGRTAVGG